MIDKVLKNKPKALNPLMLLRTAARA